MKEGEKALIVERVISHIEDGEEIKDKSLSKVTRDRIHLRQDSEY